MLVNAWSLEYRVLPPSLTLPIGFLSASCQGHSGLDFNDHAAWKGQDLAH